MLLKKKKKSSEIGSQIKRINNLKNRKNKVHKKNLKYFSTLWGKLEVFE